MIQTLKYCLLIAILSVASTLFAQEKVICKQFSPQYKRAFENRTKSQIQPREIDVHYYRMEVSIDPDVRYIEGNVSSYFTTKDSIDSLQFDLSQHLKVDSIFYHGNKIINYHHLSDIINITLPQTLNSNVLDSVQIYYSGAPTRSGFGSFVQDSYNEKDSIIWTLSQPYGASEWWPCQNNLYDKADSIDIIVRTPMPNRVASNGLLTNIDTIGSDVIYHWSSHYPIATYLIGISVTNYVYFEERVAIGNDSLLLQYFTYPNDSLGIYQSKQTTPIFMRGFDTLFGTYPFIKEKYGHASFTFGGAMEHQTMSFMGSYSGETIAHEMAHQWFGDKVTCHSWQEVWLNEGFATYAVLLTYEKGIVHDSYYHKIYLKNIREASFNHPNQSVFREDTTTIDSIFNQLSYQKGATLLRMLRWQLGDTAFFHGIRNYLNDPKLAYGFASTKNLRRHLEKSSGIQLKEFFNDWYYGKGFPTYTINWSQKDGKVELQINQSQSDPSVYFFNMPIPIQLKGQNIDTLIRINPSFSGELFNIPIKTAIDSVIFDPDRWILAKSTVMNSLDEKSFFSEQIQIYPNPTKGKIYIETKGFKIENYKIIDMNGKLVQTDIYTSTIDISSLPRGNYVLELFNKNNRIRKKIVLY